ncbi:MAG TPA: hypothetical protein VKR31_16490 [Rhizomicrobium sp.]|nr:hypothetical protein [Rhizomicrobium sp.]
MKVSKRIELLEARIVWLEKCAADAAKKRGLGTLEELRKRVPAAAIIARTEDAIRRLDEALAKSVLPTSSDPQARARPATVACADQPRGPCCPQSRASGATVPVLRASH